MSRQSTAAQRNLTLTEELEKLEQSITLTLQEIDHNFSRAHRIVTSSILPIVEQYAKHSEAVWEGSKFWKQFFEASANVSLTGYEEAADDVKFEDGTYAEHITTAGSSAFGSRTVTPVEGSQGATSEGEDESHDINESLLESPSVAHATSTPRLPTASSNRKGKASTKQPQFADYPSPYESLKREIQASSSPAQPPPEPTIAFTTNPITPGKAATTLPDMSMTPDSSPFAIPPTTTGKSQHSGAVAGRKENNDPLLHRVLDRTYRIAATPHTQRTTKHTKTLPSYSKPTGATPGTSTRKLFADDLDSSPAAPAPQLREDLFSPAKFRAARTPGVSVQTPGAKRQIRKSLEARGRTPGKDRDASANTRDVFGQPGGGINAAPRDLWDSDDDEVEADMGFSPPKTMQFHIPQSRLLQTPAREASKRIVEDLLLTAGGDITDEFDEDGERRQEEESPSVVRADQNLDDSF